jgi:hypothetical protein
MIIAGCKSAAVWCWVGKCLPPRQEITQSTLSLGPVGNAISILRQCGKMLIALTTLALHAQTRDPDQTLAEARGRAAGRARAKVEGPRIRYFILCPNSGRSISRASQFGMNLPGA